MESSGLFQAQAGNDTLPCHIVLVFPEAYGRTNQYQQFALIQRCIEMTLVIHIALALRMCS